MNIQLNYGVPLIHVLQLIYHHQNAAALLTEYQQRPEIWNGDPLGEALISGHVALLGCASKEAENCRDIGLLPMAWEGTTALAGNAFNASNEVAA